MLKFLELFLFLENSHDSTKFWENSKNKNFSEYGPWCLFAVGELSLKELHTLDVSNNQLVSSRGLGQCVGLQTVNLSHNHLSTVDDLHTLPLLQHLDVSQNALMQVSIIKWIILLNTEDC